MTTLHYTMYITQYNNILYFYKQKQIIKSYIFEIYNNYKKITLFIA